MKIEELNVEYDKLQKIYGAKELMSIYNGGCTKNPNICFVFMNPTGRNIASCPQWKGRRSPWIGTKNIWKLFYKIGLLDEEIYQGIISKKPQEWDEEFADMVYSNVEKHKYFITNLGKCTQTDARVLTNSVYSQYLDLLCKEIEIINPKIIITLGNQVSSIVLDKNISVSQCRKQSFSKKIGKKNYKIYPVYYPIGNGMMNIDKAIEDLKFIIETNKSGGDFMNLVTGLAIPFLGTTLGSAMVFLMKNKMNSKVEKLLLGFASGVMLAASIWSLIIPSIDMASEQGKVAWIPAAVGFILGIAFLLVLDSVIPHLHLNNDKTEGIKAKLKKTTMMVFAVTLHNIPEGMAVGVTFAGALIGNTGITMAGAFALAIGIAIQNFPEGAIISMPLKSEGMSKSKAFLYGTLSGIVEPIGAIITILLTSTVVPILPYLLSFAAGAMIYVVVEELIPESQNGEHSNIGTIGVALGFVIMMILDVALG